MLFFAIIQGILHFSPPLIHSQRKCLQFIPSSILLLVWLIFYNNCLHLPDQLLFLHLTKHEVPHILQGISEIYWVKTLTKTLRLSNFLSTSRNIRIAADLANSTQKKQCTMHIKFLLIFMYVCLSWLSEKNKRTISKTALWNQKIV